MRKDLGLALTAAGGMELPVTSAAHEFLGVARTEGLSGADFASVAQLLRRQAGRGEHDTEPPDAHRHP